MRSIRKTLLLATTVVMVTAFAVPAVASASNWTKEGKELSGMHWSQGEAALEGEGSLALNGTLTMVGGLGKFDCPVSANVVLSPGNTGQVTEFTGTPASCKLEGGPAALGCEVTSIAAAGLPWSVTAAESGAMTIAGMELTYKFTGGECFKELKFAAIGDITATPDKAEAIGSVSLSGQVKAGKNTLTVSGTLNATPAGKYGISNKRYATVTGTLGWNGGLGKMSCKANGTLALKPGSEGQITSFALSECSGYVTFCSIESAPVNSLPWTVVDEGSWIAIKGVSIGVKTSSCGFVSPFVGELKAFPDKTSAISWTKLEGVLNSGGIHVAWSGELNWTPAGVYGL